MSRATNLIMPATGSPKGAATIVLNTAGSIVIVGANGSGKTRLGSWFEFSSVQKTNIRRIGAQKSLSFPDSISPSATKDAAFALDLGIDMASFYSGRKTYEDNPSIIGDFRKNNKWKQQPEIALVEDYSNLLVYLISEQYEASLNYTQGAKNQTEYVKPPDTIIDRTKHIWEQILPHRELLLKASSVEVKSKNALDTYRASLMSDGERVTFYLIGQCLAAPVDSIIVIDEPEIHLHRIIQARLWDAIEQARPDCLFVYLTHDLEFAASRTDAKKIWIKNYDGTAWDWQEVPESEGIPEELLLAVLGSRKPVLFTEGDRGGSEQAIFSRVYPDWTIVPCGNCDQVIESTKAFTALKHLHGNECRGIIDRDYRTDQEVSDLLAKGIHVLDVQEVENLLLVEDVLTAVVTHALDAGTIMGTATDKVAEIKAFFFQQLTQDQQLLTSRRAGWEIEKTLRKFDATAVGLPALQAAVQATATLDVPVIYTGIEAEFTRILNERDYPALLKLYNNKGLAKRAGRFFGIQVAYPEFVKRLISGGKGEAIVKALQAACPGLPVVAPTT